MAIKKRPPVDKAQEAAIEAFGAAADRPATPPTPDQAATPSSAKKTAAAARSQPRQAATATSAEDVAKTLLIRYPDAQLPLLLAAVAKNEERSQHATALRALRRGLEAMSNDAD